MFSGSVLPVRRESANCVLALFECQALLLFIIAFFSRYGSKTNLIVQL
jgi:hypothetical protein